MSNLVYVINGMHLDTALRELRVGDQRKDISPQVFDTLEYLARHCNQVVSKDQLINDLWGDTVVTEASVSQAIRKARSALEECGIDPAVIRTQHGHGYRLDCAVQVIGAQNTGSDKESQGLAELEGAVRHSRKIKAGAIIALAGGVIVTAANVSEIATWFVPNQTMEVLEETRTTIQTTDAKVNELVAMLRHQAAESGVGFDLESERTIQNALRTIIESGDRRKDAALAQLVEGDTDAAAAAIADVARAQGEATERAADAAAASWREAGALYSLNNFQEAIRCYEAAYALQPDNAANVLDLAYSYINAERLDEANELLGTVFELRPSADARANTHRYIAIIAKRRGDFELAKVHLMDALSIAEEADDTKRRIQVQLQLGSIARAQGDNVTAHEEYLAAYTLAEELGDLQMRADSLNNLGVLMAVTDAFDDADEYLNQAYEIQVERRDLAGQATALSNLGANALKRGDTDAAEEYLDESVALGEQLGWRRSILLDLINLGGIANARGQYDEASSYLDRALEIATEIGSEDMLPIILVNLGEVARERGDHTAACRLWSEAKPILESMKHGAVPIVAQYQIELNCPTTQ